MAKKPYPPSGPFLLRAVLKLFGKSMCPKKSRWCKSDILFIGVALFAILWAIVGPGDILNTTPAFPPFYLVMGISSLAFPFMLIALFIRESIRPVQRMNLPLLLAYLFVGLFIFSLPYKSTRDIKLRTYLFTQKEKWELAVHNLRDGEDIPEQYIHLMQDNPPVVFFQTVCGFFDTGGFLYSTIAPDDLETKPCPYLFEQVQVEKNWWWIRAYCN